MRLDVISPTASCSRVKTVSDFHRLGNSWNQAQPRSEHSISASASVLHPSLTLSFLSVGLQPSASPPFIGYFLSGQLSHPQPGACCSGHKFSLFSLLIVIVAAPSYPCPGPDNNTPRLLPTRPASVSPCFVHLRGRCLSFSLLLDIDFTSPLCTYSHRCTIQAPSNFSTKEVSRVLCNYLPYLRLRLRFFNEDGFWVCDAGVATPSV